MQKCNEEPEGQRQKEKHKQYSVTYILLNTYLLDHTEDMEPTEEDTKTTVSHIEARTNDDTEQTEGSDEDKEENETLKTN